jgi:hypothetical protein
MPAQFSIGPSSYPDLFGVEQVTATERIALQFLSMKIDFDQMKADQGSGDRLSANEGRRSEARCRWLWANRFALGVVVAPPLTSRHYVSANAIDVGVTMANGQNRALTPDEFAWMHHQCELRGFTWTGVNFGEPWHIEGATRPEVLPPYPNARELVAGGPSHPGENTAPAPTIPAPIPTEGNDMRHGQSSKTRTYYDFGELTARGTGRKAHAVANAKATRGIGTLYRRMTPTEVVDLLEDIQTNRVDLGFPRSKQIDKQIQNEKAA